MTSSSSSSPRRRRACNRRTLGRGPGGRGRRGGGCTGRTWRGALSMGQGIGVGSRAVSQQEAGRQAGGQAGRRAGGQAGRRAGGQAGRRAGGQVDGGRWTGWAGCWMAGSVSRAGQRSAALALRSDKCCSADVCSAEDGGSSKVQHISNRAATIGRPACGSSRVGQQAGWQAGRQRGTTDHAEGEGSGASTHPHDPMRPEALQGDKLGGSRSQTR
ncbi:hypothetical protein BDZ91DRAFT_759005 [Kalaharituber pfeilii]|nr:hypothetical protein BDZ91DRAFT_759005 [Kalaharituber pfeilii]